MRSTGLIALCLAALVAAPEAQQAPAAITLDLVVTGADGRPVTDLRPQDLIVRLDGRPHTVTRVRVTSAPAPPVRDGLPLPYGTNTGAAGRAMAVLVDVARLSPDRAPAIAAGLKTMAAAMAPVDRLALIPLSAELRPVDFTTTHRRILDAAAALTIAPGAPRTARQDEAAVEATLGAVSRAAMLIGAEPGVKPLVLVTEPFAVTSRLRRVIQTLGDVLTRHRIALSIVTPGSGSVPAGNGVYALAAGTGGFVVASESWAPIIEQERARVEVTVAATDRFEADSLVRALVAPARDGLSVRVAPVALVPAVTGDSLESLSDMLRQSRTFTDLPLRLAAYPILHTDRSSIRLLIIGETIDDDRPLAWSEFALVAPDGRVVSQWTEERDAVVQRPLIAGVLAPEGTYRLRWAASELSGRRGTVDLDVDARFTTAGSFRLSALMLGRLVADTFVPVLQAPDDATEIEWYAEIYGAPTAGQTLSARVDVLTGAAGPPIATETGRLLTSPDDARRAMTGRLDVASLAAGDYLLRATLSINGTDAGSIARTFRKVR